MAKSRAQRKAEAAKKRQQQLEDRARETQAKAQHDTQVPESGDEAIVEATLEAGAAEAGRIDETSGPSEGPAESASASDVASKEDRRAAKRQERLEAKERERKARESAARRAPKEEKRAPAKERGRVMTFFSSVDRRAPQGPVARSRDARPGLRRHRPLRRRRRRLPRRPRRGLRLARRSADHLTGLRMDRPPPQHQPTHPTSTTQKPNERSF